MAAGCWGEFNLTSPGERGDRRSYGARFVLVDETSARLLADVEVVVKAGPRQEAFRGTTGADGRASFLRTYFLRRIRNYGRKIGYPENFLIICKREGYKTLHETVLADTFLLDVRSAKGFPWYTIRLIPGVGTTRRKPRTSRPTTPQPNAPQPPLSWQRHR
jgi:hypothetical protein